MKHSTPAALIDCKSLKSNVTFTSSQVQPLKSLVPIITNEQAKQVNML